MNLKNYTLGFGLILAIAIAIYYILPAKDNSGKATRIECQKKTISFERVYEPELLAKAIEALKNGNVQTKYEMRFSVHMPTKMGEYFTIEDVNKEFLKILKKYKNGDKESDESLLIDYYVYENDLDDPGKKSENAKKYAGYTRMNFYIGTKKVYANQIDFMDFQGKDINERLDCAIESLVTLK